MTKQEALREFAAADDAWGHCLKRNRVERYTLAARGAPHSELRILWVKRWHAMRTWEMAAGLNYDAHAIAPEVHS